LSTRSALLSIESYHVSAQHKENSQLTDHAQKEKRWMCYQGCCVDRLCLPYTVTHCALIADWLRDCWHKMPEAVCFRLHVKGQRICLINSPLKS